jgi:hypothetical protein
MKNEGLDWIRTYTEGEPLLPFSMKVSPNTIGDDLIGMRPDETWEEASRRHRVEQRVKKINKIRDKIKKGS